MQNNNKKNKKILDKLLNRCYNKGTKTKEMQNMINTYNQKVINDFKADVVQRAKETKKAWQRAGTSG